MSYSEKDGQVVLTMSRDDYDLLLIMLGYATAKGESFAKSFLRLTNRLNEGNPNYTPYKVG